MAAEAFLFRPWVRSVCRRAMIWGVGLVAALGAAAWWLQEGDRDAWGRAFAVLLAYSLLFWVSLLKIWWTAGAAAVEVDGEALSWQPLHTFRPKRIPWARMLACEPRPGTEAMRFVVEKRGTAREFFLNLAVVRERHRLLERLGEHLTAAGLEPVPGTTHAWRRPGWTEP